MPGSRSNSVRVRGTAPPFISIVSASRWNASAFCLQSPSGLSAFSRSARGACAMAIQDG